MIRKLILTLASFSSVGFATPIVAGEPRAGTGNFVLGSSISTVRAVPMTLLSTDKPTLKAFRCSGEKNAAFTVDKFESAMGIVLCGTQGDFGIPANIYFGEDLSALPLFSFENGTLYKFALGFHIRQLAAVTAALEARFGAPAETIEGKTQNRMGATFDTITKRWRIGGDEVELTAPSGELEKFQVVYRDVATDVRLSSALAKAKASASSL